jgi:malate dehydrogenase (oxaloacetate-decarboxylating)
MFENSGKIQVKLNQHRI